MIKMVDKNMIRCNVDLDKLVADIVVFVIIVVGLVCGMSVMEGGDCGMKPPTVSIAYLKSDVRDEALRSILGGTEVGVWAFDGSVCDVVSIILK